MAIKTGIAVLTIAVEGICRTLLRYRPKIDEVIGAAETAGTITGAQATSLKAWLDLASGACNVLKAVSGY